MPHQPVAEDHGGSNMPPNHTRRIAMEALTRAEQEAVVSLVDLVRGHAVGDWRAAAFLLERRHKKDWGRHETIDATVARPVRFRPSRSSLRV